VPVVEGVGALDIGLFAWVSGKKRPTGGPVHYPVIRPPGAVLIGKARVRLDRRASAVKRQGLSNRSYSPAKGSTRWGTRKVWWQRLQELATPASAARDLA